MATRRLYYDDSFQDNFSAQVLSCEPLTEAEDGGFGPRWGVILDQTLLYPTSGGQPHDLGKLGDANVVDVREKDDDRIVHFVDRPVPAGRIDGCIDWPRRFDHMQQHTGQHLLSAIFEDREIAVRYGTAEEFAGQGIRKQVDRKGILRAIEITGIDLQPCGGTH